MRRTRIGRGPARRAAAIASGPLAAFAVASGGASATGGTNVTLSVTSEVPGAVAQVLCRITVDGNVEEQAQAGPLPIEMTISGGTVDCTVKSDQPVRVIGEDSNGNRNQVQSSGGQIRLRLASGS